MSYEPRAPLMELRAVRFGYSGRNFSLGPISLQIHKGEYWAILGPNGAGKSTLVRLMAGLLKPADGSISMEGQDLSCLSLRRRAQRIGFLPQRSPDSPDFKVSDVVLMGRYPHRAWAMFESRGDYEIARNSMGQTGVLELADRKLGSLSGGEAQRVHLAAVLAQQPALLLLDEPTASLDIKHQLAVLEILRNAIESVQTAVVVVMHDVNLAAMFCSHVLLLHEGGTVATGVPQAVLTVNRLKTVYEVNLSALPFGEGGEWLVPNRGIRPL